MLADADGNLTVVNTKMLPYACAAVAFSGWCTWWPAC